MTATPVNADTATATPPVIRQASLVLLLLCLLILALLLPTALWLRPQESVPRERQSARANSALEQLFAAIELAPAQRAPLPDAAALASLLPACTTLGPHQGLPVMEDAAEQLSLLDQQLARLTAADGRHNAPLRRRYQLNTHAWAQAVVATASPCGHALQALRTLAGPRGAALLQSARWQEHGRANAAGTGRSANAAGTGANAGSAAGGPTAAPVVSMAPRTLAQLDPWRGWPGCIWVGGQQANSTAYFVSGAHGMTGGLTSGLGRSPAGPNAATTHGTMASSLCSEAGMRPAGAAHALAAPATDATPTRSHATGLAGSGSSQAATPARDHPTWTVPKHLGAMLAELGDVRRPEGALYERYAASLPEGHNRRMRGRHEIDVGLNIELTIDPRSQATAQQVAECYTGSDAACALLGIDARRVAAAQGPGAPALWERAGARMTAIAIIDVASGRIEALASAHTPCYAQEHDGPFRDAGCAPLWTQPRKRPDALLNHAVFSDGLPGSTVKPILASVLFEDSFAPTEALSLALAKSDTTRFNDELFCQHHPKGQACDRLARVQQRAVDLGWNADCSAQPGQRCANADLLFGRRLGARLEQAEAEAFGFDAAPMQRSALIGRLLVDVERGPRGTAFRAMAVEAIDKQQAAKCRDERGVWRPENCPSAALKALVNEAEGQGQARSTALGVASMMARLTAASNGQTSARRAHLVQRLSDAQGRTVDSAATRGGVAPGAGSATPAPPLAGAEPLNLRPEVAQRVLRALGRGTQALPGQDGTAHLICKHVFGARCAEAGTRLAGKTGTPSFALDQSSLAEARTLCRANPQARGCDARPLKWYVAAYSSQPVVAAPAAIKDKVIAVLSERNWYAMGADTPAALRGRVHGVVVDAQGQKINDLNNISAEVAMQVLAAQWGFAVRKP